MTSYERNDAGMKEWYHFRIKGAKHRSMLMFTAAWLDEHAGLINRLNYDLQLKQRPLLCAKIRPAVEPMSVTETGVAVFAEDALPKNGRYIEFLDVEGLRLVTSYQMGIELQSKIDRLPFQASPDKIRRLAEQIETAEEHGDISGRAGDALMYQLWQRNQETIENMGYAYSEDGEEEPL